MRRGRVGRPVRPDRPACAVALAVLLLAGGGLVGCGVVGEPTPGTRPPSSAPAANGPAEPGFVPVTSTRANRARAVATADRLLTGLAGYGGSAASGAPTTVAQPDSVRATPDQVLRNRVLRVDDGVAAVLARIRAAPPPGFRLDGSGSGSGPHPEDDVSSISFAPTAANTEALEDAQVSFSALAVDGDAAVTWLGEHVEVDYREAPRRVATDGAVHLTATGGCPVAAPRAAANPGVLLGRQFVPEGPVGGMTCSWYQGRAPVSRVFGAAAALGLATTLRAAAYPAGAEGGTRSCPPPQGSAVVVLHYPRGPDVDVQDTFGGCGDVDNGVYPLDDAQTATQSAGAVERAIDAVAPHGGHP